MRDFFPVEFPYTLGTDLAGRLEQVGSAVTAWRVGDAVVARTDSPRGGGALAEVAAVPAAYLVKAPASVPIGHSAGVPTTGGTAWQALFEVAGFKAGQIVLVHAGSGGVGSLAFQLARHVGARVIATRRATGWRSRVGSGQTR